MFVLAHLFAIAFVALFLLGVVLLAGLIREWLNVGPACVGCGCTERRACRGRCWWVSLDPPLCSNCGTVDLDGNIEYTHNYLELLSLVGIAR